MRKLLVSGLFLGLLVSCGTNAPETTELSKSETIDSTSEPSPNPFDRVSFPQDSCGDSLPDDVSDYPIQFYPVYINYREKDLQALQTDFCRDALKKFRTQVGRDVIQVASFRSLERANSFKTLMEREFGNGEIGEATLIDQTQGTPSDNTSVTKAAPKSEESEAAQSSSESPSFPKEFCGEPIPDGWERYPFGYYAVQLNRVKDLSKVRNEICRNAKYSKWLGTRVAVFSSQEKAENFKNNLTNKFGSLELEQNRGSRTDVEVSKISLLEAVEVQEAGEFCSLGAAKVDSQQLAQKTKMSQNSIEEIYKLQTNNQKSIDLKIILATNIPPDFYVTDFEIQDQPDVPLAETGYRINYENSSGDKIFLNGFHGPAGGSPNNIETAILDLIPFGKIELIISEEEGSLSKRAAFGIQDRSDLQIYSFYMVSQNTQEIRQVLNSLQCFHSSQN